MATPTPMPALAPVERPLDAPAVAVPVWMDGFVWDGFQTPLGTGVTVALSETAAGRVEGAGDLLGKSWTMLVGAGVG
jgi:hypothetical protein